MRRWRISTPDEKLLAAQVKFYDLQTFVYPERTYRSQTFPDICIIPSNAKFYKQEGLKNATSTEGLDRKKLKVVSSLSKLLVHCKVSTPAAMLRYVDGLYYVSVVPRIPVKNSKLTSKSYVQCRTK
jgi:hypothetical protein